MFNPAHEIVKTARGHLNRLAYRVRNSYNFLSDILR